MADTTSPQRVDLWELRCHYKKARYAKRIRNKEFTEKRGKPRAAHSQYRLGPGGISIEVYYYDKITGDQVLEVHRLERANGTTRWRNPPDPKMVVHNGIEYRRHGGS